jgi:transposase
VERIVELYKQKYTGFNFSHFHEKLVEVDGIELSVRSVRRILARAGYTSPKKRWPPRHKSRYRLAGGQRPQALPSGGHR